MEFSCPHCGQSLEIADSHRGALVRCPICRGEYRARETMRERPLTSGSAPSRAAMPQPRPEPKPTPPPIVVAESAGPFAGSKPSGAGWFKLAKVIGFVVLVVFVKGGHLLFRERPANPPPQPMRAPAPPFPNQAWPPAPVGQPMPPLNPPVPVEANDEPPPGVASEVAPDANPDRSNPSPPIPLKPRRPPDF